MWDEVVTAVAAWWKAHERQTKRSVQKVGKDDEGNLRTEKRIA